MPTEIRQRQRWLQQQSNPCIAFRIPYMSLGVWNSIEAIAFVSPHISHLCAHYRISGNVLFGPVPFESHYGARHNANIWPLHYIWICKAHIRLSAPTRIAAQMEICIWLETARTRDILRRLKHRFNVIWCFFFSYTRWSTTISIRTWKTNELNASVRIN